MKPNDQCPTVWNVLHDATVVGFRGDVPGTLRLEIECEYLRDRIEHPGNRFYLTLSGCSRFVYRPWVEGAVPIESLEILARRRLWILSADAQVGFCKVHCSEHIPNGSGGVLEVAATSVELTVDGGTPMSLSELEAVAEEYWAELDSSARTEL